MAAIIQHFLSNLKALVETAIIFSPLLEPRRPFFLVLILVFHVCMDGLVHGSEMTATAADATGRCGIICGASRISTSSGDVPRASAFQAEDEGSIPFTRSNLFNDLGGGALGIVSSRAVALCHSERTTTRSDRTQRSDTRLRIWGSEVRILPGAPFPYLDSIPERLVSVLVPKACP